MDFDLPENKARDMLERMGFNRAQAMTREEVAELAHLIEVTERPIRVFEASNKAARRAEFARAIRAAVAVAEAIHAEAAHVAHPDAEWWTAECVRRIKALGDPEPPK